MKERILTNGRHKVLVAPLDWGLGHATRCIPVVESLLSSGHEVWLASDGAQAAILQEAFPQLPLLRLPGYGIRYSRKYLIFNILKQLPRLIRAIRFEHGWLSKAAKDHGFTWMVTDNRYGLWHPAIRSTLITHQLALALPKSFDWAAAWVNGFIRRRVEKFSDCWVPDTAHATENLSGVLGHPAKMPGIPVRYIGWLSRFKCCSEPLPEDKTYKAVFLLSGPEPQRTMLEERIIESLASLNGKFLLVRGLPLTNEKPTVPAHTEVHNHLPTSDLQQKIRDAQFLVSRSGYSTLMDAQVLGPKCIFVPTPGQTEQEYLARKMMDEKRAIVFEQQAFDLPTAFEKAGAFEFRLRSLPPDQALKQAIDTLV